MMLKALCYLLLTIYLISTIATAIDEKADSSDVTIKGEVLTVGVITDSSFVEKYSNGNDKEAFYNIFKIFNTANREIVNTHFTYNDIDSVYHYIDDGYFLRKIVLNHGIFKNKNADNSILNDLPEYTREMLENFLPAKIPSKEMLKNYALVAFFTAKKIVGHNGFSLGRVCSYDNFNRLSRNIIVVSFYNCEMGAESEDACINTLLHELLHSLGAEDNKNILENDVMQAEGQPANRNMNTKTVASVAHGIYSTENGCFQKKESFKDTILVNTTGSKETVDYYKMLENSIKFASQATAPSTPETSTKDSTITDKEKETPVEPSPYSMRRMIEFVAQNIKNPISWAVIICIVIIIICWNPMKNFIVSMFPGSKNDKAIKEEAEGIPLREVAIDGINGVDTIDIPPPAKEKESEGEIRHRHPNRNRKQ